MKKKKSGYWDRKGWQQERTIRDSLTKDGGHLSQVTEKSVWLTGKSIQDKGNRKYNGPEAEVCLDYLRNIKEYARQAKIEYRVREAKHLLTESLLTFFYTEGIHLILHLRKSWIRKF